MPQPGERPSGWWIERTRGLLDRLEACSQVASYGLGEAGANAAAVDEPLTVVASDEQSAEPSLGPFLIGEAANDEQASAKTLDLAPAVATAAPRPVPGRSSRRLAAT